MPEVSPSLSYSMVKVVVRPLARDMEVLVVLIMKTDGSELMMLFIVRGPVPEFSIVIVFTRLSVIPKSQATSLS